MIIYLGLRKVCEMHINTSALQWVQIEFTAKYFMGTRKSFWNQKENFALQIFDKKTDGISAIWNV